MKDHKYWERFIHKVYRRNGVGMAINKKHVEREWRVVIKKEWPFTITIEGKNERIGEIYLKGVSTACKTLEDALKDFPDNAECVADANLIASAPLLLEACKVALRAMEVEGVHTESQETVREAIAKAQGEN